MSVPEGYTPPGPNSPELPPLLEQLGANSASTRLRAAGEIYTYGCSLARQATKAWFGDADVAKCFAPIGSPHSLSSGLPEATVGIAVSPVGAPSCCPSDRFGRCRPTGRVVPGVAAGIEAWHQ